ncbi:MAG TPA: LpxD N-terminal domain-containing protein [Saprospiraceae bacterium]|nr:LpxD N-terminal domain-containing protein [Saprospiraceae bacterium]HMP23774.1 LpxD N-terminal domain-containing protein [Saprospiraceae bacterium]
MDFPAPIAIKSIAAKINATIIGDDTLLATGINEIHQVRPGDITFADVNKYFDKALRSEATIVILNEKAQPPAGKAILLCADPFAAYNQLVLEQRPLLPLTAAISPTASIDASAVIEPGAIIGHHVHIGKNCHIQTNAVIGEYTILGERVVVQAGALVGTDAFYFKKTEAGYQRWRSGGRVILKDEVEIGAGCTINKGVSGDTIIGEGTKLDCQVHIGHDVVIGKRCLFAAQVGIGGNTIVGDEVVMYGQVGVAQNLRIGNRVIILAKSGISKDLEAGKVYFGYPAGEARGIYRELAALRHLPDFFSDYYKK